MSAVDLPRILLVHDRYRQRAGEDLSFDADRRSLLTAGFPVTEYLRDNREIDHKTIPGSLAVAAGTIWSRAARKDVADLLEDHDISIAHFHNTFPLISPAPYRACRDAGVPVVQTVRNFRMFCAPGTFFRDGHICEDCVGRWIPWPGVAHKCYRSSRVRTLPIASMQTLHGAMGTWANLVDTYIVPSPFVRRKLIECGLAQERVVVRPDLVEVPPAEPRPREEWALFMGRLTEEKGVFTLLDAVRRVPDLQLKIAGSGPLEKQVRAAISSQGLENRVRLLGIRTHDEIVELLRQARLLVVPSECYETFGRVVVEAFACRTPVISSRLGALDDLVDDGETGLQFTPGDPEDLAACLTRAMADPPRMERIAQGADALFRRELSPEACLSGLLGVYRRLVSSPEAFENRSAQD